MRDYLTTSQLARLVGVHPNTVRLYEQWGLISTTERTASGYRRFTPLHLEQLRLARLVLHCTWLGGNTGEEGYAAMRAAADCSFAAMRTHVRNLLAAVEAEHGRAQSAVRYLEAWAQGKLVETLPQPLRIGAAARAVGSTVDMLRNWERNNLLQVPRAANGYREYGAVEIGRLRLIRLLIQARFGCMAILRMLTRFEQGLRTGLAEALDTPDPDEDIRYHADRWLTALQEGLDAARQAVVQAEAIHQGYAEVEKGD